MLPDHFNLPWKIYTNGIRLFKDTNWSKKKVLIKPLHLTYLLMAKRLVMDMAGDWVIYRAARRLNMEVEFPDF